MGQSNSTQKVTTEEDTGSGVSLSPELEATITRDFQNQSVQDEWNKFRTAVLTRRQERIQNFKARAAQLQQEYENQQKQRAQFDEQTQAALDHWTAKFSDESVALDYDAQRLTEKYILTPKEGVTLDSKPLPCLGERAHWIDCQKKYASDSRPCIGYVEALERCVNKTIMENTKASAAQQ